MRELESILIVGAEQFSHYRGYGRSTFTYAGPCFDANPVDKRLRRCVSIVAIDATPVRRIGGPEEQFKARNILRELNKAYSGFTNIAAGDDSSTGTLTPVATGNWGCGAFRGDKRLKMLIQWLAASRAGRAVKYYTHKDTELAQKQKEVTEKLLQHEMTVAKLYKILVSDSTKKDMFEFVSNVVE